MKRFLESPRIARAPRGMALIECMMALLIFSVGLLGLLGLEARVMNTSTTSENRNRAAMLANEVASQMWLSNTVAPGTAAYNNLITNAGDQTMGGIPGGAIAVAAAPGVPNGADITVTWHEVSDPVGQNSKLITRVILP